MSKRVKVVGASALSPFGTSLDSFQEALKDGRSSLGQVPDFELSNHIDSVKTYVDRTSALALAASSLAIREAGWNSEEIDPAAIGLSLGTSWGCLDSLRLFYEKYQASGPKLAPPMIFPHAYANAPNSLVAIEFGLRDVNLCTSSGNVSGAMAIGQAMDTLRMGKAKRVLAGAVETLSGSREDASQEGEASEGGAMLALESEGLAQSKACGWLLGWGSAYGDNMASGMTAAIEAAVTDAQIKFADIAVVFYHSAGSDQRRKQEVEALRRVFGNDIPSELVDLKKSIGDTAGASASLAAVAALLLTGDQPVLINSIDTAGSAASLILQGIAP